MHHFGESGKIGQGKTLSPDSFGEAAGANGGGNLLLTQLAAEAGVKAVEQGLAALGEGGPNHPEEPIPVAKLRRGGFGSEAQDGGGDFWCREKTAGRNIKQQFHISVILA